MTNSQPYTVNRKHRFWKRCVSLVVVQTFLFTSVFPAWAISSLGTNHSMLRALSARNQAARDGGNFLNKLRRALSSKKVEVHDSLSPELLKFLGDERAKLAQARLNAPISYNVNLRETKQYLLSDTFRSQLENEGLATNDVKETIAFLRSKDLLRFEDLFYLLEQIERVIIMKNPSRIQKARYFMESSLRKFIVNVQIHPDSKTDEAAHLLREAQYDPALQLLLTQLLGTPMKWSFFLDLLNYLYFMPYGILLIDKTTPTTEGLSNRKITLDDLSIYEVKEVRDFKAQGEHFQRVIVDHPQGEWLGFAGMAAPITNHVLIFQNPSRTTAQKIFPISNGEKKYELDYEPPSEWPQEGASRFTQAVTSFLQHSPRPSNIEMFRRWKEQMGWEHEMIHKAIRLGLIKGLEVGDWRDEEFFTYPWELSRPGAYHRFVGLVTLLVDPENFDRYDYPKIHQVVSDLLAELHKTGLLEEDFSGRDFRNPLVMAQVLKALEKVPEGKTQSVERAKLSKHSPELVAFMDELISENGTISFVSARDGAARVGLPTDEELVDFLKKLTGFGGVAGNGLKWVDPSDPLLVGKEIILTRRISKPTPEEMPAPLVFRGEKEIPIFDVTISKTLRTEPIRLLEVLLQEKDLAHHHSLIQSKLRNWKVRSGEETPRLAEEISLQRDMTGRQIWETYFSHLAEPGNPQYELWGHPAGNPHEGYMRINQDAEVTRGAVVALFKAQDGAADGSGKTALTELRVLGAGQNFRIGEDDVFIEITSMDPQNPIVKFNVTHNGEVISSRAQVTKEKPWTSDRALAFAAGKGEERYLFKVSIDHVQDRTIVLTVAPYSSTARDGADRSVRRESNAIATNGVTQVAGIQNGNGTTPVIIKTLNHRLANLSRALEETKRIPLPRSIEEALPGIERDVILARQHNNTTLAKSALVQMDAMVKYLRKIARAQNGTPRLAAARDGAGKVVALEPRRNGAITLSVSEMALKGIAKKFREVGVNGELEDLLNSANIKELLRAAEKLPEAQNPALVKMSGVLYFDTLNSRRARHKFTNRLYGAETHPLFQSVGTFSKWLGPNEAKLIFSRELMGRDATLTNRELDLLLNTLGDHFSFFTTDAFHSNLSAERIIAFLTPADRRAIGIPDSAPPILFNQKIQGHPNVTVITVLAPNASAVTMVEKALTLAFRGERLENLDDDLRLYLAYVTQLPATDPLVARIHAADAATSFVGLVDTWLHQGL